MTSENTFRIGENQVSKVGFGTARIGGDKLPDNTMVPIYGNEQREKQIIQFSMDLVRQHGLGMSHIDTARIYGAGHTEEVIGQAIETYDRRDVFLATKVGATPLTEVEVVQETEGCLQRLNTPYIDLLYLHNEPKDVDKLPGMLKGLASTVNRGLVRAVGVSNFHLDALKQAVDTCAVPITAYQARYNVLSRGLIDQPMIEYCIDNNITIVAHTPLGRGAMGINCDNAVLLQMAKKYDKTPAQIALAWIVAQPGIVTIPRSHNESHIKANFDALGIVLESADIEKLTQIDSTIS